MMRTLEFAVIGEQKIHCTGCEQRIGNALRRLPSVRGVRASAQTQRVAVTVDLARSGAEQVRARLEGLGYEVAPNDPTGGAA